MVVVVVETNHDFKSFNYSKKVWLAITIKNKKQI